jgi:hypothetical protein
MDNVSITMTSNDAKELLMAVALRRDYIESLIKSNDIKNMDQVVTLAYSYASLGRVMKSLLDKDVSIDIGI